MREFFGGDVFDLIVAAIDAPAREVANDSSFTARISWWIGIVVIVDSAKPCRVAGDCSSDAEQINIEIFGGFVGRVTNDVDCDGLGDVARFNGDETTAGNIVQSC